MPPDHQTVARRGTNAEIRYWLRRPDLVLARARYWLWEKRNPDKPWLCPDTVRFCEQHLSKAMKGLEFGSGRSTAWFAKHLGHLTSVEHDAGWYSQVKDELARRKIDNVDYRLVPLNHPQAEPERAAYVPVPAYVATLDAFEDESLDLIIVDGHYRTTCITHCPAKLKPGGLLLVDDVNLWGKLELVRVPGGWPLVHGGTNGIKRTCLWQKPAAK